jgi:hypothetical protein
MLRPMRIWNRMEKIVPKFNGIELVKVWARAPCLRTTEITASFYTVHISACSRRVCYFWILKQYENLELGTQILQQKFERVFNRMKSLSEMCLAGHKYLQIYRALIQSMKISYIIFAYHYVVSFLGTNGTWCSINSEYKYYNRILVYN